MLIKKWTAFYRVTGFIHSAAVDRGRDKLVGKVLQKSNI